MGRILTTHYNAKSLAEELIDGGDMTSCWTDERWDDSGMKGVYGPQYYSARGEDIPPSLDNTLDEYLKDGEDYEKYVLNIIKDKYKYCWLWKDIPLNILNNKMKSIK